MKTIERIKLYCKSPKCIAYDFRDWKDSLTLKFYHKLKEMLYSFENKTYYNINITQHYKNNQYQEYYFLDKTVTFARLICILIIVLVILESLRLMSIHKTKKKSQSLFIQ